MSDETTWAGAPRRMERRSTAAARKRGLGVGDRALLATALVALLALAALLIAREAAGYERRAADRSLAATTEAAAREFEEVVADAEALARSRAADVDVVRALGRRDRLTLARIAAADDIAFIRRGRVIGGRPPGTDAPVRRSVDVIGAGGRIVGSVVAAVRFEEALVERLERVARPGPVDDVVLAVRGRIVAGSAPQPFAPSRVTDTVTHSGTAYRAASTQLVSGRPDVMVATLRPIAAVDSAAADRRNRVLLATLATLVALLLLAAAGLMWRRQRRYERRTLAIERDRRTVRDALSLVGDALASTHDTEALLPVIVQTALEAAGATGARLLRDEVEVMRAGRPSASKSPLILPLGEDDDGHMLRLHLYAPAGGPLPEARELAEWFVSQAAIALENARLHGIVKRQAITDPLTGLANRRRFVEALEAELSRAERFDTELAVVIADLDDFKNVNDSYGHEVGNDVLRAFADLITATLRDVDVAARLGGEEFAMLLPQTDLDGGLALAERIRSAFAATPVTTPDGGSVRVTGSFGVSSNPPGATVDTLLRAADSALYRAKAAGKDRVEPA